MNEDDRGQVAESGKGWIGHLTKRVECLWIDRRLASRRPRTNVLQRRTAASTYPTIPHSLLDK